MQPGDETPVSVYVTVIQEPGGADEDRGRRMADILGKLANAGGVRSIADPVQWQREQREDRDIPGRP
jgi:hypothetical protein